MRAVPAAAMSAAEIAAVNCAALTTVVIRSEPFTRTTEPLTKFMPLTVSVNAAAPAITALGLTLAIAGVGLG